jgi:hypothetical protein
LDTGRPYLDYDGGQDTGRNVKDVLRPRTTVNQEKERIKRLPPRSDGS